MNDAMKIHVIITSPYTEEVHFVHSINLHEANEFALVPIHKPIPDDFSSRVDYGTQMDRRKRQTENIGIMIAHDMQRFLENIEKG